MKKIIITLIWLYASAILVSSCSKSKTTAPGGPNPPSGPSSSFFANTEWTGTAAIYGYPYNQPCSIRFNGDTAVTLYALFNLIIGNSLMAADSLVGKITDINAGTGNAATISVNFPQTNDQQVYTISDNTLLGGSSSTTTAPATAAFTVQMRLWPAAAPSVAGTGWATNKMVGGPIDGMYEFPDITTFDFGADGNTSYVRNGKYITYTPPDQDKLLQVAYAQIGPRVYFSGFNETNDKIIPYFGVLTPGADTIWADARDHLEARLPNYLQTIYWYGPPGTTPHTQKLK